MGVREGWREEVEEKDGWKRWKRRITEEVEKKDGGKRWKRRMNRRGGRDWKMNLKLMVMRIREGRREEVEETGRGS